MYLVEIAYSHVVEVKEKFETFEKAFDFLNTYPLFGKEQRESKITLCSIRKITNA